MSATAPPASSPGRYRARRCTSSGCGLRFPVPLAAGGDSDLGACCPSCGAPTELVDEAWSTAPAPAPDGVGPPPTVEVLVDNVRSLSNVGAIFRTADGAGVAHIHLAGITPTPDHPKLDKTALGAQRAVAWSHHRDPVKIAAELAASGRRLWGLEGGDGSVNLLAPDMLAQAYPGPVVLVVGHEVSGIDPRVLRLCERVVHLPMAGAKTSLNVSVALGIALYAIRYLAAPMPAKSAG